MPVGRVLFQGLYEDGLDWRKQHRQICKRLNVGHGDMQVRTDTHTSRSIYLKEQFEREERILHGDQKRFFKLFRESTLAGSRVAARKMRKIAKQQTKKQLIFLYTTMDAPGAARFLLNWPATDVNFTMLSGYAFLVLVCGKVKYFFIIIY
jgi:hypothetical protein